MHMIKTFRVDPIEISDERFKNVFSDMCCDYVSDVLTGLCKNTYIKPHIISVCARRY